MWLLYRGWTLGHAVALIPTFIMELSVRRGNHIGDRNWSKQPLFAPRRRSYLGWVMLLMAVFVGAVFWGGTLGELHDPFIFFFFAFWSARVVGLGGGF